MLDISSEAQGFGQEEGENTSPWGEDNKDSDSHAGQYFQHIYIVAVTGVFEHQVAWCQCVVTNGKMVHAIKQLFAEQLFSATQKRPKTVFTFDVLEHFWVDMMECKTSNYSFFQKLARITNPAFPHKTPVRSLQKRQNAKADEITGSLSGAHVLQSSIP